jgi:signal transduction histidine kinase
VGEAALAILVTLAVSVLAADNMRLRRKFQRRSSKRPGERAPGSGNPGSSLENATPTGGPHPADDGERTPPSDATERLLRDAIDLASEGFVLFDAEDRLVLCNRKFREIYEGIADTLVPGRLFEEILNIGLERGQFADAVGREREWLAERLRNHRHPSEGVEQALADGRWLLITERRTAGGGTVGLRTDITDLKRREDAVGRSERNLTEVVEAIQEGFALFDQDDRLVLSNTRYREIFPDVTDLIAPGVRFEELIRAAAERGQNVEALEEKEQWIATRLEAHRSPEGSFQHQFTDGRWVRVTEHKTSDGRTLSSYVDITELKLREQDLVQAKEQAEAANRAKDDFLANVSHELRTPLNAIIGFSDLISKQSLGSLGNEEYLDYAANINESGTHLLDIISDILDISKLEAGRLDLNEEPLDLSQIFSTCEHLIAQRAESAEVELSVSPAEQIMSLRGDRVRLKQVVINLLSNAVKFTPKGGRVTLDAKLSKTGDLLIQVADSGIGMTDEEIEIAFERFRQVDTGLARHYPGTGLGLPIAKSLVELHGGSLAVRSVKQRGTTVTVRLPAARLCRPAA